MKTAKKYNDWKVVKTSAISTEQLIPIERALLGSCLVDPSLVFEISAKKFMFANYERLADIIFDEIDKTGKADVHIIASRAKKVDICSTDEVYKLIANANTSEAKKYSEVIFENWQRREEVNIHKSALARLVGGEDVISVLNDAEAEREEINGFDVTNEQTRLKKHQAVYDNIVCHDPEKQQRGYKTGLTDFDRLCRSFGTPNRYRIWAARPGMAKTTLALSAAVALAKNGCPVLFVSLEQIFDDLLLKIIQMETGISSEDIEDGLTTASEKELINKTIEQIYSWPLYFEDSAKNTNWPILKNKIRFLKKKHGIKQVFIDYVQKIKNDQNGINTRNSEIESISNGIMLLANSEELDFVVLSQLSRWVEKRGGGCRPVSSDLRDSGTLEQDAGQILFPYRAEKYGITEDTEGNSLVGVLEIIPDKNRYNKKNGLKSIFLRYDPVFDTYRSIDEEISPTPQNMKITAKSYIDEDLPF